MRLSRQEQLLAELEQIQEENVNLERTRAHPEVLAPLVRVVGLKPWQTLAVVTSVLVVVAMGWWYEGVVRLVDRLLWL